jgi:AcrR family transcriptional regulator
MMTTKRLPTAERRRQIAEAALRIIAEHGVRRLTAAAVAEEVGIADGTIFRHFRNMEEIVHAAIDFFEVALESTYPPPTEDPLDRLGLFLVARLSLVQKQPELLRLAFNDRLAEAAGEKGAQRIERLVKRSVAFVRQCLKEAQGRGLVTQEAPSLLLVWMVIGVIRGAATGGLLNAAGEETLSSASPEQVWRELESFLRSTHTEKKP